ncbi:eukaryotic translation initiation factor 4 gamma 1-like [Triplophysa dalaica]|uniref:eukaryotic translation initiation factor 4 gamma 1-like n=1 Tax=Triplophysa dalaica TaxID=1582913 RepID=UPI0024DFA53A|nr:eukaryotic translation initiation factor 4 gamma 1-like [Triplophysa dalaica]
MVYKKAISDPSSSGSYASMCRSLAMVRVPMKNKPYIDVGFKSLLLQFCWKQIETDQDVKCLVNSIKFFIELFKQKLLSEAIMQECVVKLLKQQEGKTLKCLCHLLTSVGKEMDVGEAKSKMDAHFTQLKNLVKEQKRGSKRIRNMMKDVLVLRMNDWVPQETKQQNVL